MLACPLARATYAVPLHVERLCWPPQPLVLLLFMQVAAQAAAAAGNLLLRTIAQAPQLLDVSIPSGDAPAVADARAALAAIASSLPGLSKVAVELIVQLPAGLLALRVWSPEDELQDMNLAMIQARSGSREQDGEGSSIWQQLGQRMAAPLEEAVMALDAVEAQAAAAAAAATDGDAAEAAEQQQRERQQVARALGALQCAHVGCTTVSGTSEAEIRGKRCGGCGAVRYCGTACSRADWRAHKAVCKVLQAEAAAAAAAAEAQP